VRAIGDSVAVCPPFIVTEEQVAEIFALFERGLNDTLDWARKEKLV
jgi:4-aminobutyrate--pyruvate transaminase